MSRRGRDGALAKGLACVRRRVLKCKRGPAPPADIRHDSSCMRPLSSEQCMASMLTEVKSSEKSDNICGRLAWGAASGMHREPRDRRPLHRLLRSRRAAQRG